MHCIISLGLVSALRAGVIRFNHHALLTFFVVAHRRFGRRFQLGV